MSHVFRGLCLLAILLLAPLGASGLGVTPAKERIIVGYDAQSFEFTGLDARGDISVRIEGDLAGYVETHVLGSTISGSVGQIPDTIPPGVHTQRVILGASAEGGGTVSAREEIAALLEIVVPRPDAFLDAAWQVIDTGSSLRATVMLENLGMREVTPDSATILLAAQGRREELLLSPTAIGPAQTVKLTGSSGSRPSPGIYEATLSVGYAGKMLERSRQVAVGKPALEITELSYDSSERGLIIPLDISGTTGWNVPLSLEIEVFYDNGTLPVLVESLDAEDSFSQRFYLDTAILGVPSGSVRVVVSARGVVVERVVMIDEDVETRVWPMLVLLGVIVLLGLFVYVRMRRE